MLHEAKIIDNWMMSIMEWWHILGVVILEINTALFFAGYFVWRGSPDVTTNNSTTNDAMTKRVGGCSKGLNILFSPGIFVTIFMVYVGVAMFLFIPLHPDPSASLWRLAVSIITLTLLIYPPVLILTITRTVIASRTQQIIPKFYLIQMFFRSIMVVFFGVIVMWFGIHS